MNRTEIKAQLDAVYAEIKAAFVKAGFIDDAGLSSSFIAGGCFASMVNGETVKDYDLWFTGPEGYERAIESVKVAGELGHIEVLAMTKYAITTRLPSGRVVQFVESRMGTPSDVVETFDFLHTRAYYMPGVGPDSQGRGRDAILEYDEDFLRKREAVYMRGCLKHPINTVQRLLKFKERGYAIGGKTISDLLLDANEADPCDLVEETTY